MELEDAIDFDEDDDDFRVLGLREFS